MTHAKAPPTVFRSLSEAVQRVGVHYETVAQWVRSGELPAVKLSRRKVLVPKQQCDALLPGGSTGGAKEGPEIGAPQRWLTLVGTLTPEEARKLRAFARDFEEPEQQR